MEMAKSNLEKLRQSYRLFLLTQGRVHFQRQKVESLGIASYFEDILIFHPDEGLTKTDFFVKVQTRTGLAPHEHLSIGNRLSTDLRPAKKLGWKTCLFAHGEHQDERNTDLAVGPLGEPDFVVYHHRDLILTCKL